MNKYFIFMGVGFELMAVVLGSLYIGDILDKKYGTNGLCTITILVLCLVGWFTHFIKLLLKLNKDQD